MKTKTLTEEIQRIKILMEAPVESAGIYTAIGDIIMRLSDEFTNLASKNIKVKNLFDDLGRATTNDESFKILMKLSKESPQIADQIIPRITDALGITEKLDLIKSKMINLVSKTPNLRPDLVINDFFEQVGIVGGKLLDDELDNIVKSRLINEVMNGYNPTPIMPVKVIPAPKSNKIIDQMESVFKKWDSISPGTLSIKDKALLVNETVFRGLRAKLNWTLNNLMNLNQKQLLKSEEKIVGLLKQASSELLRDANPSPQLFKVIDAEIDALRGQQTLDKKVVYDLIEKEINKVIPESKGSTIVQKLKENDALGENARSYFQDLIDEKLLKDIVGKENLLKRKDKITSYINWLQRILIYFSTGYVSDLPKLFSTYIRQHGTIKGFGWMYFYFWTLSKTIYPAAFTTWAWIKNGITGDENFEDTETALWEFYRRELNEVFGLFRDDFLEVYGLQIPPKVAAIIRTLNPFTWMWDDIKEGLDWFTKGGLRTLVKKLWNGVRDLFGGEISTELPTGSTEEEELALPPGG